MLSYQFCIKTLFPGIFRNKFTRSGNESHLRGQAFLKNSWRVTVYKVRFTKLKLHANLSLDTNSIACNRLFESWPSTRMYRGTLITDSRHCYQQFYVEQRPKYISGGMLGTMGHPKGRKLYGGGDSVRESGFRRFSSTININENSCVELEKLMKLNKSNPGHMNDKLIHIVSDIKVLILAYEIIKSNPETPDMDSTTLDKIDLNWFIAVNKELKAGKYRFNQTRHVCISKSKKKSERPLSNDRTRDKVVQQAIYIILNAIYEQTFLNSLHSAHVALKSIKSEYQDVAWCINAGIESKFPNINHKILVNLLSKRIACSKFLALIKKSIKGSYIINKKPITVNKSLFQVNIISIILNNIYLHQLDLFMSKLMESFNGNKYCTHSPDFKRIQNQMEKSDKTTPKLKNPCRENWKINKSTFSNFKKLYYTRYMCDFVVGLVGSRKNALDIHNKIDTFLKNELKLVLSSEKVSINHFSKTPIFFLGTIIRKNLGQKKQVITKKKTGSVYLKIGVMSRVVLKPPIRSIFEKASLIGFFKKRLGVFVPTYVGRCINLDHQHILRYYNFVISSVLNYYSFADNRKPLNSFIHGLKLSCARTLALKYKLRHASKVYRKFGYKLASPDGGGELYAPPTFKAIKNPTANAPIPMRLPKVNENTSNLLKNNSLK
jgi:retron-type reverse transcriptase